MIPSNPIEERMKNVVAGSVTHEAAVGAKLVFVAGREVGGTRELIVAESKTHEVVARGETHEAAVGE